uniref:Orf270 protein n=1 Tax=Escherichia coli TaxID=562 RepID=Q8VNM9_ECOLX|nr:orf270 [Escherichia coli]
MATGSDAGCPAEYTAGTMTADWLCITEPDIYIPQNIRLMAFLMFIFAVAEISHFFPDNGDRHTGHIGGHHAPAFIPDMHHRVKFTGDFI